MGFNSAFKGLNYQTTWGIIQTDILHKNVGLLVYDKNLLVHTCQYFRANCWITLNVEAASNSETFVLYKTPSDLHVDESVHHDIVMKVTNKKQLYRLIYFSLSVLHVLGDVFAHYRQHLTVFTVSGSIHPFEILRCHSSADDVFHFMRCNISWCNCESNQQEATI